jgi:hypothetical protein
MVGDFDGSSAVDQGDYGAWRASFGSTTNLRSDGNHDGIVDAADIVLWRKAQPSQAAGQALADAAPASDAATSFAAATDAIEQAVAPKVAVVSARPLVAASEVVADESARTITRDDAPRRAAFALVAEDDSDLNLLASLGLNADDPMNDANANDGLEPAILVQAQAIDTALDSVFARQPYRPLRAAW